MRELVVVIDAGHGGSQAVGNSSANNATGPKGLKEKEVTLDLALRTKAKLQSGSPRLTVLLTRDADVNLGLKDRAKLAADKGADVFLSIHFNGNTDPNVQGTETWVHAASTADSRLFATVVLKYLVAATNYADRKVRKRALGVLSLVYHLPTTAASLAEVSFITAPDEEKRLASPAYRDKIATAFAAAIRDYLGGASGTTPMNPLQDGPQSGELDG